MNRKQKPCYVLGLGLSHHGSACLLKDGEILVAIEKERVTRVKHDGFNDTDAILYCLEVAGITLSDIGLVVQNTVIGMFEYGNAYFKGKRVFDGQVDVPIISISHHMAHAYAAIGLSPFTRSAVFVLDGNGSPYNECLDLDGAIVPQEIPLELEHLFLEKDSFYIYGDDGLKSVYKDFTPVGYPAHFEYVLHPGRKHSMGGMYDRMAHYCGLGDNPGKLMGLAPYGRPGIFTHEMFELKDGRTFTRYDWIKDFHNPARSLAELKKNFQYYADLAYHTQKELERGILYLLEARTGLVGWIEPNLCYSGGVALNAVTNHRISTTSGYKDVYITPAAGDNGIAIGCAYYGWLEVLKREKVFTNGNTCYGRIYSSATVKRDLDEYVPSSASITPAHILDFLQTLAADLVEERLTRAAYSIQILIEDAGTYVLQFRGPQCEVHQRAILKPDCVIRMDAATLIRCGFDLASIMEGVRQKNVQIVGDSQYFLEAISGDGLMHAAKKLAVIAGAGARYLVGRDVIEDAALLLAEGKIIGWFQGGSEFGPRALGHRSILGDPRRKDIRDFINANVKFREDFRPFAPSVLAEDVNEYFHLDGESPYMLMITQVREKWRNKVPGIVHVDGSARIQTVTPEWNERYYRLLQAFKVRTGIGMLLNTSFNTAGMPIVETPSQAIQVLHETALDVLVIDDFIVYKEETDIRSLLRVQEHAQLAKLKL